MPKLRRIASAGVPDSAPSSEIPLRNAMVSSASLKMLFPVATVERSHFMSQRPKYPVTHPTAETMRVPRVERRGFSLAIEMCNARGTVSVRRGLLRKSKKTVREPINPNPRNSRVFSEARERVLRFWERTIHRQPSTDKKKEGKVGRFSEAWQAPRATKLNVKAMASWPPPSGSNLVRLTATQESRMKKAT